MKRNFLGIDIGGTWLKGMLISCDDTCSAQHLATSCRKMTSVRVKSHLTAGSTVSTFIHSLSCLLQELKVETGKLDGIGVSTAGIVRYDGSGMQLCASHLSALMSPEWIIYLREKTGVSVTLVNDAEAACIGAAGLNYLSGNVCYGIAPIGTGLGFVVLRNGRRWCDSSVQLPLLGSVYAQSGSNFDSLVGVSQYAQLGPSNSLKEFITDPEYENLRNSYLDHLAGVIYSSSVLYGVEEFCIAGGFANAVSSWGWDIKTELEERLLHYPVYNQKSLHVRIFEEGNQLPLIGAVLLARGNYLAIRGSKTLPYSEMQTEKPYDASIMLHQLSTASVLEKLFMLEQEAGAKLKKSLPALCSVVDQIVPKLANGGRLIYVGCGTSGRLAAIDAVEQACTFGFPRDKVLTFISGGVMDAAIDIEQNFEEDASAIPELLMANISSQDVVIGISVSGRAFYVQSALAYAKHEGALSVMVQAVDVESLPFCDYVLPLNTGGELIAGSTRMKAGTATKKILNFISTTVMIRLGKVHGCYMTELECLNEKLVERAIGILQSLFGLSEVDAMDKLKLCDYNLNQVIKLLKAHK